MVLNFNHIAKRFRDFNMKNLKICTYDLYYNQMPELPNVFQFLFIFNI